jgi:hypothetical protein
MSSCTKPIALLLAAVLFVPLEAAAQAIAPVLPATQPVAAPNGGRATEPAPLTLKERLGAKWKDEQRVDNCKVPPEKRGTKPRPDSCVHAPLN